MFEKCIRCDRLGQDCVPNFMLLSFSDLIQWCVKKQKDLGWTNQMLADKSTVPVGTINRIKAGDYADCKYSTIKNILVALVGGISTEFPCKEKLEFEMKQIERFEQQTEKLAALDKENKTLKNRLSKIDEQHRKDIRAVREEYQEQIVFLKEQLKAWQAWHHKEEK